MSSHISRCRVPFALVAAASLVVLGACGGEKKGPDSTSLGADTTLSRDLALANRDTNAQPQLKDIPANAPAAAVPKTTRPVERPRVRPPQRQVPAPTPTPVPAPQPPPMTTTPSGNTVTSNPGGGTNPRNAGGGEVGTIAAGTNLSGHAGSKICTNTNAVGDHVTAIVDNSVSGSNGAMIPAGATMNLTVTRLKRSENSNDPIIMEFAVNSVTFGGRTYPVEGVVTSAAVTRVRDESQAKDVQKVATGAVIGAIAGRIIGRSTKGTVIGGAAGAAAGAAAASATANYQGCIEAGGNIVVKLTSAATVKA
jgi:hypothetical protein